MEILSWTVEHVGNNARQAIHIRRSTVLMKTNVELLLDVVCVHQVDSAMSVYLITLENLLADTMKFFLKYFSCTG
jgi:hypothetical protein